MPNYFCPSRLHIRIRLKLIIDSFLLLLVRHLLLVAWHLFLLANLVTSAQWFRQLKRQTYYRLDREEMTSAHYHQQRELWWAIRQAPGFGRSFSHWWSIYGSADEGASPKIPLTPPSYAVAYSLFDHFRGRVRSLENQLTWTRIRQVVKLIADGPRTQALSFVTSKLSRQIQWKF